MARPATTPTTYWFRKIAVGLIAACGTAMTLNAAGAAESLGSSAAPLRATGPGSPSQSQESAPFGKKRAAPLPSQQKALAPGDQQAAEANEPSRQDLRPASADDKEGAARTGERTVRANAFPAAIEELKKDRKLKLSDFRQQRPAASEVNRLMAKAASGPIRVIVTLKTLLTPEGLLGERLASEQRGTIALQQQRLLDDLRQYRDSSALQLLRQFDAVPMLALKLNAEALAALSTRIDVAAITEDVPDAPLLNGSAPAMGSADALDRGFSGSGWNVAVLDSGIDRSHQFLRGFRAEACFSANNTCPNGATTQTGPGAAAACTFSDGCFHGTAVSGIATGASQSGLTNREGAARNASLIPVQIFSRITGSFCADGVGPCLGSFQSDQIAALQYVFNQRSNYSIAAATLSLGGSTTTANCDNDPRKPIIDMLRSVNIATVIASGNDGLVNAVTIPACISSAISVGATDNDGNLAFFSNVGNASLLDLVAPGVNVTSSCPYAMFPSGFCISSGTSFAVPHVAGAFAVMQSQANRTVAFNEARLEDQALRRADQRNGGVEMNLRGADVFDALASINRLTLTSGNPESVYRTPRPIPHTFNYTATRSSWSVAALRQSSGVDVDMVQCEGPVSDNCAISGSSGRGLYGDGVTTIDLIATNHDDGLRPFPETMGLRFNQFSTSSFAAPDDGFYGVQVSQARDRDFGSLYGTVFTGFGPRQILQVFESPPFSAGTRLYIRAVHEMPIELYAFSSDPADPASHVRGVGSADAAAINLSSGASEISFVQRADSWAGIVVVNRGGEGEVILYSDDTAPTGSVLINGGAASTTTRNVTLTLAADDGTTGILDMRVAVDGVADSEAWEPYITSKPVTLAQTAGTATVAVQFRNNAGMISDSFTDSITVQATPVVLNVADVSVVEGNAGTTIANVTISLTAPSTERVTGRLATSNGTAIAGSDYASRNGDVSFAPGQTERVIAITVNGDVAVEPDENFFVTMSNVVNATLGDGQGVVTIVNDDAVLPTLSINDTSVAEGNSGTRNAVFTVTLSAAATSPVSVSFATANGTATAGSDYLATSGSVTIPTGARTAVINVPVNGDTLVEPNETLFVNLSASSGATLADAQGLATISNDDSAATSPGIGVNVSSFNFGNVPVGGSSVQRMLIISSTGTAPLAITSIRLAGDYVGSSACPASLAPGATCALTGSFRPTAAGARPGSVTITSNAPSSPTVVQLMGTGTTATPSPSLSINDVSVDEIDFNTGSPGIATFTVRLSAAATGTVSVNYTTADGTARAGGDYRATSGTLTFAAGQTTRTATVSVIDDNEKEPHETFSVALSNVNGSATIADGMGVATIIDDDVADSRVSVTISDVVVAEGRDGRRQAVFYIEGPTNERD